MVAHRLEKVAVRAEAEEEAPHLVLVALVRLARLALILRARRLRVLRLQNDQERKLNRSLYLATVCRAIKAPELGGLLRVVTPEVVEVQKAVAVLVVVVRRKVQASEPSRVDVVHRGVAEVANPLDEGVLGFAGVPRHPPLKRSHRLRGERLLLVVDAHEVFDVHRREIRDADVDVKSAPLGRPRALLAEFPHHLLQGVHVLDGHHRRHHLGGGSAKTTVAHDLPFASVGLFDLPIVEVRSAPSRNAAGELSFTIY